MAAIGISPTLSIGTPCLWFFRSQVEVGEEIGDVQEAIGEITGAKEDLDRRVS